MSKLFILLLLLNPFTITHGGCKQTLWAFAVSGKTNDRAQSLNFVGNQIDRGQTGIQLVFA